MFGACRGMDTAMFFHPASERDPAKGRRIAQAKAVCNTCPVLTECRTHALQAREPYGIWGGFTSSERALLLRTRPPVDALPRRARRNRLTDLSPSDRCTTRSVHQQIGATQ